MVRMIGSVVFVFLGLVAFAGVGSADVITFDDPVSLTDWYTDRYAPGVFERTTFDGDYRLLHGIRSADSAANRPSAYASSFYNTQGRKFDTNLAGSVQTFSIDLYVGSDWGTNDRYAGIWGTGIDGDGNISAYPIIQFRNFSDTDAGFYTYDYIGGAWENPTLLGSGDYGDWYNLEFVLTKGVGVEYYVNGSLIGSQADPDTISLTNVILNAGNYGEDYNVYWDNFTYSAIPEPGTFLLIGVGLAGLGAVRRRRNKRA